MAAPAQPTTDVIASGRERDPARRRSVGKVWQAIGVAALVAGAAAGGPDLLAASRTREPPQSARQSARPVASTPTPALPSVAPAALPAWKVRGNLATNRSFLGSVLDYVREDRPDSDAALLFAGALPHGGRVVLVAFRRTEGANPEDPGIEVHALHLRPGQDVGDARLEFTGDLADDNGFVGWAGRGRNRHVYAVVVGPPEPIEAEISGVIEYEPDGGAHRAWRRFTGRDGSAVIDLGTRTDRVVAVRPPFDNPRSFPLLIRTDREAEARGRATFFAFGPEDIKGVGSPSYLGPPAVSLVFAVGQVTQSIFEPADADLRLIWSGSVEPRSRGALIRARLADGPTFHVLVVAEGTAGTYSASVRRVARASADVTPWLLVRPETGAPVLLLNPSGAGTATIEYDGKRRQVDIDKDGISKLATDQFSALEVYGAKATIFSASGRRIVRSTLTHPGQDDIFVLK